MSEGDTGCGGQIILLLPGNGIFIDFINHSRSQEKSKYAPKPAQETSNGSIVTCLTCSFHKISGAWEMMILMILTHYECQCCRRWLVVVPSPTLTFLQNMQLYIPMGICMLMFRYCRINCYHQPQPGPVVRRCSRFVSSDIKPQPF